MFLYSLSLDEFMVISNHDEYMNKSKIIVYKNSIKGWTSRDETRKYLILYWKLKH